MIFYSVDKPISLWNLQHVLSMLNVKIIQLINRKYNYRVVQIGTSAEQYFSPIQADLQQHLQHCYLQKPLPKAVIINTDSGCWFFSTSFSDCSVATQLHIFITAAQSPTTGGIFMPTWGVV